MFSLTISEGVDLVTVDKSSIPGVGYGVWSRSTITPNTLFGPYKDDPPVKKVNDIIIKQEIIDQKPDISKLPQFNWVKYLNCAKSSDEENMVVFEENGLLYFGVTKTIPLKTELFVNKCLRHDCWKQHNLEQVVKEEAILCKTELLSSDENDDNMDMGQQSDSHNEETDNKDTIPRVTQQNYVCKCCNEEFSSRTNLVHHLKGIDNKKCSKKKKRRVTRKRNKQVNKKKVKVQIKSDPDEKPFPCTVCELTFSLAGNLKRHMRTHTGEKPYPCSVCGRPFADSKGRKRHMVIHTETDEIFSCALCETTFTRKDSIQSHMKLHARVSTTVTETGETRYTCTQCDFTCSDKRSMKIHLRSSHGKEKRFPCPEPDCEKTFTQKCLLQVHMLTHTGERPYPCTQCSKSFSQKANLARHLLTVHSDGTKDPNFQCHICGAYSKELPTLKIHMRIHTGERPYLCTLCGDSFGRADSLTKHMVKHTGVKAYGCDYCEKRFGHSSTLAKHKYIQHFGGSYAEKKYPCEICGVRSVTPGALKVHMRIHTGEKPFPCTSCNSAFRTNKALQEHMRTHTGTYKVVKSHMCNECGKRFEKPGQLKQHMNVHTGETPYCCEVCGKAFAMMSNLRRHMRSHTGEKPYSCHICGNRYVLAGSLKIHIRTHTGDNPYKCQKCDMAYNQSSKLVYHMRKHHN